MFYQSFTSKFIKETMRNVHSILSLEANTDKKNTDQCSDTVRYAKSRRQKIE
jgi:hypothetical protein